MKQSILVDKCLCKRTCPPLINHSSMDSSQGCIRCKERHTSSCSTGLTSIQHELRLSHSLEPNDGMDSLADLRLRRPGFKSPLSYKNSLRGRQCKSSLGISHILKILLRRQYVEFNLTAQNNRKWSKSSSAHRSYNNIHLILLFENKLSCF